MDLLSSGQQRPPEPRARPWLVRARRLWRHRGTRAAAVYLVLGRYCLDPGGYTFTLDPDHDGTREDYHHVDVLVFRLASSGSGPDLRLILDWAGRSYRWLGFLNLLDGC